MKQIIDICRGFNLDIDIFKKLLVTIEYFIRNLCSLIKFPIYRYNVHYFPETVNDNINNLAEKILSALKEFLKME
jgi:hypothetical protein